MRILILVALVFFAYRYFQERARAKEYADLLRLLAIRDGFPPSLYIPS